jgi:arylsulfatase A-like enzyme
MTVGGSRLRSVAIEVSSIEETNVEKGNRRMSAERPNVIWVFADQMRGQAMSCATERHGPDCNVHTPNLDRLAGEGTRFSAACSSYLVCVPFRFTAMTGQYAHSRVVPTIHYRMSPAERTIADEFTDAGYHTAYFGKWHLDGGPMGGPGGPCRLPENRRGGFREWHGFNLRNDYYDTWIQHDDAEPVFHEGYQTDVLFDLFCDWLRQRDAQPFFGALSFEAPHPPMEVPEENRRRQADRRMWRRPNVAEPGGKPFDDSRHLWGQGWEEELANWEERARCYYAMVENADDNLGRLMGVLEETGLADDTVVLFFADHGELLGSHHLFTKSSPYEESINIPFIVRGPGIRAGQ